MCGLLSGGLAAREDALPAAGLACPGGTTDAAYARVVHLTAVVYDSSDSSDQSRATAGEEAEEWKGYLP
jgi:hypothetical protein